MNAFEAPSTNAILVSAKSHPSPPQRILAVDDDADLREIYSEVLMGAGYQVDTAADGAAGWKRLQTARSAPGAYDLLIADHQMPKVSGVELVTKLRSARISMPVILATCAAPVAAERLDLAAILFKPFEADQLVKTVADVLRPASCKNGDTPKLKASARKLLMYEATTRTRGNGDGSAVFRVCDKLSGPLGKLMGVGGFRALLARALVLAGAEVTWLLALWIRPDGHLGGFGELGAKHDPGVITEGEIALLSQLLGLLATFIGSALTVQLLRDIWPKVDDLNL